MLRRRILRRETGGFVGAYDPFEASLAHVYEPARRTLASYTGALCRLRRASDDAELDCGYIASGELDIFTIGVWAGGASYVVSIYDQVVGDTVTQADKTRQPLFVASAQNGHAGATFDGANDSLSGAFTTGGILSQPIDTYSIIKTAIADFSNRYIFADDTDGNGLVRQQGGQWGMYYGNSLNLGALDLNHHLLTTLANGVSSQIFLDSASLGIGNAGAYNANGIIVGNSSPGGATPWWGNINAIIICDPVLSAGERAAMFVAMNNYWAVH